MNRSIFKSLIEANTQLVINAISKKYNLGLTTEVLYNRLVLCDEYTEEDLQDQDLILERIATHFEDEFDYDQLYDEMRNHLNNLI
ncbi:hypothetical protein Phi19:2_gp014 [Cellulophaga phage phi19:2]|uniref:Uncharacterized protein n=3 Tax=Cellulophaga phage phiST TaxID=756282 RepID=M4SNC7_9CAUD|nr:hypothetical protein CGPG_00092 [Cellulophaga phage phiST]AGH56790.1 hypothetical protein CGPG_00092 [Cellulophaga phage phiST]AGO47153.1 hypothetical protein PhiST_gp014 [Cellulophaga phage phiST]AGO48649.1 hypothetical protein Phi19:2_gp014 [Cellulophaga phage phi19:2]AGO49019.1 hypothetical protein Phi13:1_gp008 [Cellulophaga phage phi13:1]